MGRMTPRVTKNIAFGILRGFHGKYRMFRPCVFRLFCPKVAKPPPEFRSFRSKDAKNAADTFPATFFDIGRGLVLTPFFRGTCFPREVPEGKPYVFGTRIGVDFSKRTKARAATFHRRCRTMCIRIEIIVSFPSMHPIATQKISLNAIFAENFLNRNKTGLDGLKIDANIWRQKRVD